jgi:hypothetical protein
MRVTKLMILFEEKFPLKNKGIDCKKLYKKKSLFESFCSKTVVTKMKANESISLYKV